MLKRKRNAKHVLSETNFEINSEECSSTFESSNITAGFFRENLGDAETSLDPLTPCRSSDVAVNPNKLDELRTYFKRCFAQKGRLSRCLLLTGPSGCGKTTAVQVIVNELGYEVVEFSLENTFETREGFGNSEFIYETSEEESFISFLRKADYCSLDSAMIEVEEPVKKVMIVEQLPNAFIRDPARFRATIEPLLLLSHSVIVFIFSDSDSTYDLSFRRFFPREFIIRNNIAEISMNASAASFLRKALQRVARYKNVKVSTQEIRRIAEESNGDIRCAMRTFDFSISSEGNWIPGVQPTTNTQINLFQMLGRVLYAKRQEDSPENKVIESRLQEARLRRPPLERDLDEILSNSGLPDNQALMFLGEHSPNFSTSIKSLSTIMMTLAACDARRPVFYENSDRMLKQANSYVAANRIMFENYADSEIANKKRSMYKFTKSKWADLCRSTTESKTEVEICARMQNIDGTGGDLFTLRVPFTPLLNQSIDSLSLRTFGYLGRKMNYSWTVGRDLWLQTELANRSVQPFNVRVASQNTTGSTQQTYDFDIVEDSD